MIQGFETATQNDFKLVLSISEITLYNDSFQENILYFSARNQMTGGSGLVPYLEKRRLLARNSDRDKYDHDRCWDLSEYANDRKAVHEDHKARHLVHPDSRMAFDMYFDTKATGKHIKSCVFFYDKELKQAVFVAKINPHPRIDTDSGKFLPPCGGNGNHAYAEFLENGLSRIPRMSSKVELARLIPEKVWAAFGVDALKTFLRDGETFWKKDVDMRSGVNNIMKRHNSAPAMSSIQNQIPVNPGPLTLTLPLKHIGPPDTPETPETPGTPETPETPGTPGTPETPGTPGTPMDAARMVRWRGREPLTARTDRARCLRVDAAEKAAELLADAPENLTAKEKKTRVKNAVVKRQAAAKMAKEVKDLDDTLLEEKREYIKEINTMKKQKQAIKAVEKAKGGASSASESAPTFASSAFFPFTDHDEKEWIDHMGTVREYFSLREARVKKGSDGSVMRKKDRVLMPGMELMMTSWMAMVEEDEAHFAFLREQFLLDSRNGVSSKKGIKRKK